MGKTYRRGFAGYNPWKKVHRKIARAKERREVNLPDGTFYKNLGGNRLAYKTSLDGMRFYHVDHATREKKYWLTERTAFLKEGILYLRG